MWPALLACGWLVASLGWSADDGLLQVALQVELGLEYARSHHDTTERRLAAQTTLRTGLTDRLELRLDSEPLVRIKEDSDDVGLGNIALGVKDRVFEPPGGTA